MLAWRVVPIVLVVIHGSPDWSTSELILSIPSPGAHTAADEARRPVP
jgi:hypothetical protein